MDVSKQSEQRYRAKAARRPVLFWWQAFFMLGMVVLLWRQLPLSAVLYEPRVIPPLPEAHAAYVTLDPAYAAEAFKKSLTAWTLSGTDEKPASGLELGGIDLDGPPRPPEYLEQGAHYPGVWQPSAVVPLPQRVPDVRLPPSAGAQASAKAPEPATGVRVVLGQSLMSAGFAFPAHDDAPPERSGQCRFYVETGADGAVEHVLLLSARTLGASVVERSLLKGRAKGAARGIVDLYWYYPKS